MKKKKEKKFSLDKKIKSLIKSYRKKWNAMGERK